MWSIRVAQIFSDPACLIGLYSSTFPYSVLLFHHITFYFMSSTLKEFTRVILFLSGEHSDWCMNYLDFQCFCMHYYVLNGFKLCWPGGTILTSSSLNESGNWYEKKHIVWDFSLTVEKYLIICENKKNRDGDLIFSCFHSLHVVAFSFS